MSKSFSMSNRFHLLGFTLLEMIVALVLLSVGMLGVIQLFPAGLQASVRIEDKTRAAILAQQILESLKADIHDLPFIEGSTELFPIPGNGFDDDPPKDLNNRAQVDLRADRNFNGKLDIDFDGNFQDLFNNDTNEFGADGLPDVLQDSPQPEYNYLGLGPHNLILQGDANGDGDPYYDPENFPGTGIDEEFCDGIDNDGDGLIDEDCQLATNRHPTLGPQPFGPGDGIDNDGDGEEGSPTIRVLLYPYPPIPNRPPQLVELKIKDGVDNNGDGRVDEGIDEEIFDGRDNDGDGLVDEDCRLASYPFTPRRFPPPIIASTADDQALFKHPNEKFSWQVFVGRVSDGGGDGLDNDGDGQVDEDPRDGIDNDQDGRVDEDPSPMPLPGFRKVIVRITWGGDLEDEDNDGRVDEELKDGLDDDFDGRIDEDTYEFFYELTGFIQLKTAIF